MRHFFEIIVALAVLGCVLALPAAADTARDSEPAVAAAEDAQTPSARRASQDSLPPPPLEITLVDILERDWFAIIRDHARDSYEAAVDALRAEARTPERARTVKAALRQLVNTDKADLAEAIFKDILERKAAEGDHAKRDAAAAARHSVALVELPAALAPAIKLPSEIVPFAPLGQKAAPAYARAAELDPDNPWTWIVRAWLADPPETFDFICLKNVSF